MANVPRKHHYVPQVLLAGFTRDGTRSGALHIVDLLRHSTYASTPEGTAKERDYNLIEVKGVDPWLVETELMAGQIEGPAAPALERIRRGRIPSDAERERLLALIAMQALRTPNRRDAYDEFMTDVARIRVSLATETDEMFEAQKRLYPELDGLTREEARALGEQLVAKNSPGAHLRVQLPSFGTLLQFLSLRSWVIMTSKDADFVCCDDPVVLLPSGTRRPEAPRSFASLDAQVLMPVGRKHALLGVWPLPETTPTWMMQDIGEHSVAALNTGLVIIAARRFVASADENFVWLQDDSIADRAAFVELVKSRPGAVDRHEKGEE
jgi:hypothetical protein